MTTDAEQLTRAIASFGLTTRSPIVAHPLGDEAWRSLVAVVRRERVVPLLDRCIDAGELPSSVTQRREAESMAAQALRGALDRERLLLEVAERLRSAKVDLMVLKGPAIAHLDEAEPSLRTFADLDVLVRSSQLPAALACLGDMGFRRDLPPRRPWFDTRFAKEVPLRDNRGREIDVHRLLALGALGFAVDDAALWQRCTDLPLGEVELRALDDEARFVHACLNALVGDETPRLVALRDVVLLARRRLDPGRLRELLAPGHGAIVIPLACALAGSILDVDVPECIERTTPTRWERSVLAGYRARGGSNTAELLMGAAGLPTWRDRGSYLLALLRPSTEYRAARRDAARPREWHAGLLEVLRHRRRPH